MKVQREAAAPAPSARAPWPVPSAAWGEAGTRSLSVASACRLYAGELASRSPLAASLLPATSRRGGLRRAASGSFVWHWGVSSWDREQATHSALVPAALQLTRSGTAFPSTRLGKPRCHVSPAAPGELSAADTGCARWACETLVPVELVPAC